MSGLTRAYGAGPLHLLATIATFALAGYAFIEISERPQPLDFALWFGGAIIAHDLIAFPVYSALALVAGGVGGADRGPSPALNYVRIPAVLSAFALIVFFPLILGLDSTRYEAASGMGTEGFLGRWLLLTAALFAGSGLAYAIRARRARPRGRARDRPGARVPR